jgi:prepilin-type N-terminal cleavage/methylation domain-containing protein
MQAIAAATLEGKPVDVDFGPSSGPALGGGGGGVGSWSGMIYIHRMQNGLSSNLDFGGSFSLSLPAQTQYDALLTKKTMTKSSPPPAERGFTLIEFLVVVLAIGILAALAVPALNSAYERAKVTKDLSNLRQIGAATQLYMNDNNGVFPGSATVTWISQLELNQKYLTSWRVFESPFDKRLTSELVADNPAVSYGINASVYDVNNAAMSADEVTKHVTFIAFAPAQASGTTVSFQGTAAAPGAPGVTVNTGGTPATSNPGGTAVGGPHNNRAKINALCAD